MDRRPRAANRVVVPALIVAGYFLVLRALRVAVSLDPGSSGRNVEGLINNMSTQDKSLATLTSASSSVVHEVKALVDVNKDHYAWLKLVAAYAGGGDSYDEGGNVITEQAFAYRQIAKTTLPSLAVFCETGFFKGISSHLWMDSVRSADNSRSLVLHSFDIKFPKMNLDRLRKAFSSDDHVEIITHLGSTRDTLRVFRPENPCNLLSIDGSHDGLNPYYDLRDLLPHTKCASIVLFDDTFDSPLKEQMKEDNDPKSPNFFNACSMSYWRAVKEGLLEHVNCQNFGKRPKWGAWPKGYCLSVARGGGCQ